MAHTRRQNGKRLAGGAIATALMLWMTWQCGGALAQGEGVVSYQPFVGLRTATFHTANGDVKVNLPDDMSAGDLVSGTTVTLPGGNTDAERGVNASKLAGYKVAIEHNVVASGGKEFSWHVSPTLTGGNTVVTLQDPAGSDVASANVTVNPVAPTIDKDAMPSGFVLPSTAQAGQPVQVYGQFDGNMSTSQVKVGGAAIPKLAESPRKLVAQVPASAKGASNIEVSKNGRSASAFLHICGGEPPMFAPQTRRARQPAPQPPNYQPNPDLPRQGSGNCPPPTSH